MAEWGLTSAGYKILKESGLGARIDSRWTEVYDLLPRSLYVEDEDVRAVLKGAPKSRADAIRAWKKEPFYDTDSAGLFVVSGAVTDAILTEEERRDPGKFGFSTLAQLDGTLASYCIVKRSEGRDELGGYRRSYNWRTQEHRTKVYGDSDGDLQIDQLRIGSGDPTMLFGKLHGGHVNASYDYWPTLAAVVLKYSDVVGMRLYDKGGWRDMMTPYGWDGDIRRDSGWSIGYESFLYDYVNDTLPIIPDNADVRKVGKMFMGNMAPNANHKVNYVPAVDPDGSLAFYSNFDGGGEPVEIAPWGTPLKYYQQVRVPKDEAHHLLRGAVHGIMTRQSRTAPSILAYMFWEHEMLKGGMPDDEIKKEGQKFKTFGT
jgi:hypothetical protein